MLLVEILMSFFFLKSHTTPPWHMPFPPTSLCQLVCECVSACAHVHMKMCQRGKGKEAQHNDTVKCSMSPHCTWQIIRHALRASFFRQTQKQGRFALRVNVIIGTVWQQHQIRTCHRTGCMVMLESVAEQVCKTGESIPSDVCCFILVALYCCCNIVPRFESSIVWLFKNMLIHLRYRF